MLAQIRHEVREDDLATQAYEKILALDPTNIAARQEYAEHLQMSGESVGGWASYAFRPLTQELRALVELRKAA